MKEEPNDVILLSWSADEGTETYPPLGQRDRENLGGASNTVREILALVKPVGILMMTSTAPGFYLRFAILNVVCCYLKGL